MTVRWQTWWRLLALAFDATALTIAMGGAALLRFGPSDTLDYARPDVASLDAPWLLAIVIWIVSLGVFGLYSTNRCANGVEEARRVVTACLAAPGALLMLSFAFRSQPSRLWMGAATIGAVVTVGVGRRALRGATNRVRAHGHWITKAVVAGGRDAKLLVDSIATDPTWGLVPVSTCGFSWGELPTYDLDELHGAVEEQDARSVIVVAGSLAREDLQGAIAAADDLPVDLLVAPGLDYTLMHNLQLVPLGGEPAVSLERPYLRVHQRLVKRTIDVMLSAVGLLATSPLLLAAAIAIRAESPGSVFFKQQRVGRYGNPIEVWKFRTMVADAERQRARYDELNETDGVLFKMRDDPRLTRVGRFLRRWSIDELPQLWNVLRGDMSVVGPRPLPVCDYELDTAESTLRRRLLVRPGLTGLWQINGRSDLSSAELVRYDVTYVQNWALILDAYIILRTLPSILSGRGAY